jgi:hypothetical protein
MNIFEKFFRCLTRDRSGGMLATRQDLRYVHNSIMAKLSDIKVQVAEAATKSNEALVEITRRLDELINGATDPNVTDEVFLANLETLRNNVAALANIADSTDTTDSTDTPGTPGTEINVAPSPENPDGLRRNVRRR